MHFAPVVKVDIIAVAQRCTDVYWKNSFIVVLFLQTLAALDTYVCICNNFQSRGVGAHATVALRYVCINHFCM